MKLLDTIRDADFSAPVVHDENTYATRTAARAVLIDEDGAVLLMYVGAHGYHKLPGGGIDEDEDMRSALARELMEEVGCSAEIVSEIGEIVEYRDFCQLKQTSYCFLAKKTGDRVANSLEQDELDDGMYETSAKTIDDAIALFEKDEPDSLEGQFICRRDSCLLREAKIVLDANQKS